MTRRPIIPWPYNLLAAAALALLLVGAVAGGFLIVGALTGDDEPLAPLDDEQEAETDD